MPLILLYAVMMPSAPLSSIHLRNGSRYSSYYSAGQSKSSSSRGRPRCCFHRSVSGLMHSTDILDRRPAFPRCKRRPFFRSAQGPRRSPPRFFPISDHARGQRSVPSGCGKDVVTSGFPLRSQPPLSPALRCGRIRCFQSSYFLPSSFRRMLRCGRMPGILLHSAG